MPIARAGSTGERVYIGPWMKSNIAASLVADTGNAFQLSTNNRRFATDGAMFLVGWMLTFNDAATLSAGVLTLHAYKGNDTGAYGAAYDTVFTGAEIGALGGANGLQIYRMLPVRLLLTKGLQPAISTTAAWDDISTDVTFFAILERAS